MLNALSEVLNPQRPVCIALSGGVDSVVLAHLAHQWAIENQQQVHAVHVNHGISANADEWTEFVKNLCEKLGITLNVARISLDRKPRESLEAIARTARYNALIELSPDHAQIILGHHLDDQLETILLALKRGAGALRLGGIQAISEAPQNKQYVRPLLDFSKEQILTYAKEHQLSWVEDESNADSSYDRNFLRNEIIPVLKNRWGGILSATSHTSKILQSENRIVELHTKQVLEAIQDEKGNLIISKMADITDDERKLAIRLWIKGQGVNPPREDRIDQIYDEVALARPDRHPCFSFGKCSIRRKKGLLTLEVNQ